MSPNPYRARLAKKRRRKPGDVHDVLTVLWHAVLTAESVLEEAQGQPELQLRACHCVAQTAGQYIKALEVGELEARLKVLEDKEAQHVSY